MANQHNKPSEEEKIAKINSFAKFGEVVVRLVSVSRVIIKDPEYGEFEVSISNFRCGSSIHPMRRKKINDDYTYEQRANKVPASAKNGETLLRILPLENKRAGVRAIFTDPVYGEFECLYHLFINGKAQHPNRYVVHNKIPDEIKIQKLHEAARFGETFVKFLEKSAVVMKDPEFGEYRCGYHNFIAGKSTHQKRKHKFHLSKEDAEKKLKDNNLTHLSIKEWGGKSTAKSVFVDADHGEFSATLRRAIESGGHRNRTLKALAKKSKENWDRPEYKEMMREKAIKHSNDPEVQAKRRKTMLERTGYEHAFQNPETLKKAQATTKERFGSTSYAKSTHWQEKDVPKLREKFRSEAGLEIIKKRKVSRILNGSTETFEGKTMQQWADELGKAYSTIAAQVKEYGFEMAIRVTREKTGIEIRMEELLRKNNIPYNTQRWSKDGKWIYDFVVEDRFVIECNGVFWHSDKVVKDNERHLKKRLSVEAEGKELLMFLEPEINHKIEIIEAIILERLGRTKNPGPLVIKELDPIESEAIFNAHHLLGSAGIESQVLFNEAGKAVAGVQIRAGVIERMFGAKYLGPILAGKELTYNLDLRFEDPKVLLDMGFKVESSFIDYIWTKNKIVEPKAKYTGDSGYAQGMARLWDCGLIMFSRGG